MKRRLVQKRPADEAGYKRYWEMMERGLSVDKDGHIINVDRPVYRCMHCNSVSRPKNGWDGRPDISACTSRCRHHFNRSRMKHLPTDKYRQGYDRIRWETNNAG